MNVKTCLGEVNPVSILNELRINMQGYQSLPHTSGVYLIENTLNHHKYVGQSRDIYKRVVSHHMPSYRHLDKPYSEFPLYRAMRKYGIENFQVSVLELCPPECLNEAECKWIQQLNTFHDGYNGTEGGTQWSPIIHSPETEAKRAATREQHGSLKGAKHPRAKLSEQEVWDIRQRYRDGESCEEIHRDFQDRYHSIECFKRIIFGKAYKYIGNVPSKDEIRYTNKNRSIGKHSPELIREIRAMHATGQYTYVQLEHIYHIPYQTIAGIVTRRTYKSIV
jgi:group I intron endonuclease